MPGLGRDSARRWTPCLLCLGVDTNTHALLAFQGEALACVCANCDERERECVVRGESPDEREKQQQREREKGKDCLVDLRCLPQRVSYVFTVSPETLDLPSLERLVCFKQSNDNEDGNDEEDRQHTSTLNSLQLF